MSKQLHKRAESYIGRGYSIVPLRQNSKKAARTEWSTAPKLKILNGRMYGVGIETGIRSGFVVADLDHFTDKQYKIFIEKYPTNYVVKTRRGWHLYYKISLLNVPKSQGKIDFNEGEGEGEQARVDFLSTGRYVVAPPTEVEGWVYKRVLKGKMAQIPDALIAWVDANRKAVKKESKTAKQSNYEGKISRIFAEGFMPGEHNQGTLEIVSYFRRRGVSQDIVFNLITNLNRQDVSELSDAELLATFKSAWGGNEPDERSLMSEEMLKTLTYEELIALDLKVEWSIKDWLIHKSIIMLAGESNAGKTVFTVDMAISIASGCLPFLGQYPVKYPGKVIFINQEDSLAASREKFMVFADKKIGVWERATKKVFDRAAFSENLIFSDYNAFELDNEEKVEGLRNLVEMHRPVAVFFDPLYSMLDSKDHMAKAAMYIKKTLRGLRDEFETSFIIVHHTNKAAKGQERASKDQASGAQTLNAAMELMLIINFMDEMSVGQNGRIVKVTPFNKYRATEGEHYFKFEIDTDPESPRNFYRVTSLSIDDLEEIETFGSKEEAIIVALRGAPRGLGKNALVKAANIKHNTIGGLLKKLKKRGEISYDNGERKYFLEVTEDAF